MTRCGTAVKRSLGCASVLGSLANKPVPPRKKEPNTDGRNTNPACEYNIKIKLFEKQKQCCIWNTVCLPSVDCSLSLFMKLRDLVLF